MAEFFYDQQINNANTSWVLSGPYTVKGILIDEDFGFDISHTFNDGLQGQVVKNAMESVTGALNEAAGYAPVANSIKPLTKNIAAAGKELSDKMTGDDKGLLSKLTGGVIGSAAEGLEGLGSFFDKGYKTKLNLLGGNSLADLGNGHFMATHDMIQVFGGSKIQIGIPQLKTIIFHGKGDSACDVTNVKDWVDGLKNACLGTVDQLGGVFGFQKAPADYKPDLTKLGSTQTSPFDGTWTLRFAGKTIKNLLVTSVRVNLSKYKIQGDPLYAEVSLEVQLASSLTKPELNVILNT